MIQNEKESYYLEGFQKLYRMSGGVGEVLIRGQWQWEKVDEGKLDLKEAKEIRRLDLEYMEAVWLWEAVFGINPYQFSLNLCCRFQSSQTAVDRDDFEVVEEYSEGKEKRILVRCRRCGALFFRQDREVEQRQLSVYYQVDQKEQARYFHRTLDQTSLMVHARCPFLLFLRQKGKAVIPPLRKIQIPADHRPEKEREEEARTLLDCMNRAYAFAKKMHEGQVDRGGKPYILHPCTVRLILAPKPYDVSSDVEHTVVTYTHVFQIKLAIVAYLHDVIEDTKATYLDLANEVNIPADCLEAIHLLTKEQGQTYQQYLEKIRQNELARLVKIADLIHNSDWTRLKKITQRDKKRMEKYGKSIAYLQGAEIDFGDMAATGNDCEKAVDAI